jgi:hypothetical protein
MDFGVSIHHPLSISIPCRWLIAELVPWCLCGWLLGCRREWLAKIGESEERTESCFLARHLSLSPPPAPASPRRAPPSAPSLSLCACPRCRPLAGLDLLLCQSSILSLCAPRSLHRQHPPALVPSHRCTRPHPRPSAGPPPFPLSPFSLSLSLLTLLPTLRPSSPAPLYSPPPSPPLPPRPRSHPRFFRRNFSRFTHLFSSTAARSVY